MSDAISVELNIYRFFTLSKAIDFGDVFYQQKLTPQHIGDFFKLRIGISITIENNKNPVNVTVIIHHNRGPRSGWQAALSIMHLAAQLVPDLGQRGLIILFLHGDRQRGKPTLRAGFDFIQLGHLLHRHLHLIGDLFLHLTRSGSRIRGDDQGVLDGELRVLKAAHVLVADDTSKHERRGEHKGDCLSLDT